MKHRFTVGAFAVTALVLSTAVAGDALKSGLQVGGSPTPFHPLNVTGAKAGEKHCLVWQYGGGPVAAVFARGTGDNLTSLVKKLDKASTDKKINSFVVFLSDEEKLGDQLKELAEKNNLKKTVLAIDNPAGPQAYKISKDADVTVIIYNARKVEANHAFKKGELNEKAIEAVISDLSKIEKKKS
jgi:hypothetical protein